MPGETGYSLAGARRSIVCAATTDRSERAKGRESIFSRESEYRDRGEEKEGELSRTRGDVGLS